MAVVKKKTSYLYSIVFRFANVGRSINCFFVIIFIEAIIPRRHSLGESIFIFLRIFPMYGYGSNNIEGKSVATKTNS